MRRIGLVILALCLTLAPLAVAQQARNLPRIGGLYWRLSGRDCVSLDMSRARTSVWSLGMPGDGLNGSLASQLS
jgi:hypothetical protein